MIASTQRHARPLRLAALAIALSIANAAHAQDSGLGTDLQFGNALDAARRRAADGGPAARQGDNRPITSTDNTARVKNYGTNAHKTSVKRARAGRARCPAVRASDSCRNTGSGCG